MSSSVKSGFTTINRLLGKKSKDEIPVDPHSSPSSTGHSSGSPISIFSKSMSNLDSSSQYNKIVPLAAMNNAPFEQTFRITVALPRDQLYVVRVGAKMKLQQILEMTCTAKQLDPDKYEFRHPVDNSTVFSNGCTIGEVGLNEIRLVPISERRQPTNTFSSVDLGRLPAGNRNSYAAPSSNTTITTNGTSPPIRNGTSNRSQYSSTNSLNSFESVAHMQRAPGQPVPPMRKKRAAPRPPSQHVIPEDSPPMRQMSFHVSSPNLSQNLQILSVAGNKEATPRKQNRGMRPVSMFPGSPLQSAFNGSAADLVAPTRGLSRSTSNASDIAPGAAPRRKKAAPAPPPRSRDSITPQPAPRSKTPVPQELVEQKVSEPSENVSKTLLNAPDVVAVADVFAKVVEDVKREEHEEEVLAETYLEAPPTVVDGGLRSPVPIAIDTRKEVETVPKPSPTAVREQMTRMNSYNLNTGKCVEADIVPNLEDATTIEEEEPEMSSQAIEDMILQEITDSGQDTVNKPHVVEDLYAEVKKVPKKELIESPESKTNGKKDQEQRSTSPMWTYTLPAPMHFADGNNNNLLMVANGLSGGGGAVDNLSPTVTDPNAEPTETFNGNVYYNYSVNDDSESIAARSMTTTVVSDVIITPVIKERIPMLDQPLMLPLDDDDHFNNISESSDFNSSSTLTSASPNNIHGEDEDTAEERRKKLIINSDIEDGYHGPDERMFVNQGLIDTLEKRREKFIESELAQLVANETSPSPENNHPELMYEETESKTGKASTIVDENQEPTISRSPIEDGLPSARDFIRQQVSMEDSGKDSDMFNSSEGSKNDSLETTSSSQVNVSHQSFEQRRSSYLAELENSKNLFNRKPSNELSISDVPSSLQSLQVMRNIMMTAAAKKVEQEESVLDNTVDDRAVHKFDRIDLQKEEVKKPVVKEVKKEDPPKPVVVETKPWKYTGPPKINLGSWSERPKIQVCLKTDSDYHHSRQKAAAEEAAKAQQKTTMAPEQRPAFEVASKEKLPVVLRPVELRKAISVPEDKSSVAESIPAPQPPTPTETVTATVKARIQRPVSMHSTRFTPTVRGFVSKSNEDSDIRSTMINPVLMRSDSNVAAMANGGIAIRREEDECKLAKELAPVLKSPPVVVAEKGTLFSQSTLRRTGLKDRIMSSPPVEEPSFTKEVSKAVEAPPAKVPLKSILVDKSAGQGEAVVVSSPVSPPPPPPPPMPIKSTPGSLLNPLARLSIPPAAQIGNDQEQKKVAAKPIVRGMVAKRPPITPEVDPREQLLDSIRNFSFSNSRKV